MRTVRIRLERPHPGQRRVLAEAKRFNVLQCGRRFGKTTLGVNRLVDTAIRGHPAAWFAPTYKYLTEVWRQTEQVLAPLSPRVNQQQRRIDLVTRGSIEFWSLDEEPARGRKYARVVLDEAGMVRNLERAWQEAIRPTLTDLKGDAWFLGTPKGQNFFQRLYARGQSSEEGWMSWRMPTTANPVIDPSEVEAARRDLPPRVFDQEYLGVPSDDGGNPFGLSSIAACVGPLGEGPATVYGVDLAKSLDWTVVCGLNDRGEVCTIERWQSDWDQTRRRVLDLIGDTPALIDSTGVGDPIVEDICRQRLSARGYKFTATSKQQIMEGLASAIQRRELRFPDGWLVLELESFQYEYRPGGGVRYQAPEGQHDDGVVGLALAVQCMTDLGSLRVPVVCEAPAAIY